MQIINPATEEIIREVQEDKKQSLQVKYEILKAAQPAWAALGITHRVNILQKFSSGLENQIETLASVLTAEVGKPLQQSRNEINGAVSRIRWLTENAEKYLGE